jgi:hypothetical protein
MLRSGLIKAACVAIALSGFSTLPAKAYVVHRGVTAVGPRGGVYHRGGTWAGHPYGGYGYHGGYYHGGYGYRGYGYRPYGYGAAAAVGAAAVGAAVVAPHCWINNYGYRVCN